MTDSNTPGRRVKILVVDDDATVRLFCEKVLRESGFQVRTVEGSPEAMELCSSGADGADGADSFDVALVDIFLPPPDFQLASGDKRYARVNGHELVSQMLTVKKAVRVLYMSARSHSDLAKQGIALDPARFLPKPLSKDLLLSSVAEALAGPPVEPHHFQAASADKDVQWVD
ncbi:MAG TPA: response regulator [Nitrospira sp.]|nr:response regulator [Nitrospira sp.]